MSSYVNKDFDKKQFIAIDNKPGIFHIEKDDKGRTVSMEGWVNYQKSPRPSEEKNAQQELQKNAPKNEFGQTYKNESGKSPYYQASHIIPYKLGGQGKDNLVLMPGRINQSYVSSIEKELSKQLEKAPTDKGLYVKATLTWGESNTIPERINHQGFVEKSSSSESLRKVHDSGTKVNWHSQQTLGKTLNNSNNCTQNTSEWASQKLDRNQTLM